MVNYNRRKNKRIPLLVEIDKNLGHGFQVRKHNISHKEISVITIGLLLPSKFI